MNLTVKDILKHSFVITINDERLNWFKKVFKFHGLEPMPKKFMGTTLWYNSPQYNCYLSHKNAILKGTSFSEGATARDRNNQIGGHKA